jgi:hypothetical protein
VCLIRYAHTIAIFAMGAMRRAHRLRLSSPPLSLSLHHSRIS